MWSPLSGTQDDTGATKLQAWTKPTLSLGLPLDKIFRNSFPSLVSPHSELSFSWVLVTLCFRGHYLVLLTQCIFSFLFAKLISTSKQMLTD